MWKLLGGRRGLARNEDGNSAVELAIIAPMILLLGLGAVDAVRLVLMTNKVNRAAATTADMVTRHQVLKDGVSTTTGDAIGAYFVAANNAALPHNLEDAGRVYISGLVNPDGRGARVAWQRTHPDYALDAVSRVGEEGGFANLPGDMTVAWGETTVVAEVFYEFRPLILSNSSALLFHRQAFFRPRLGGLASLERP